jgi:UrcA family protein
MNKRLNRLMKAAPLGAALGLGAMMLVGTGPVLAQPQPSVQVQYGDLNTATPEGVRELSNRIQTAAWQVCNEASPRSTGPASIDNVHCQEAVIKQALDAINMPQLTARFPTARDDASASSG